MREGGRYSLRTATGEAYAGRVEFVRPPRGFYATVESLNDALFWLTIEGEPEKQKVQLWLSAYGLSKEQVDGFRDRWASALEKVFSAEGIS